jgi:hypothetical protein
MQIAPLSLRQAAIQGQKIGVHDTGLFDREDSIRVGKPLGHNLDARAAQALAFRSPGAELIVRTTGAPGLNHQHGEMLKNPLEKYDVFALSVIDRKGVLVPDKVLNLAELTQAVSLDANLVNRFEDPQTGLVPAGLTLSSSDQYLADIKIKGGAILERNLYTLAPSRPALGSIPFSLFP